jgi:magnesium-transporting ATPase (P-type)
MITKLYDYDEDLLDSDYRGQSQQWVEPIRVIYFALQSFLVILGISMTYYAAAIRETLLKNATEEATSVLVLSLDMSAIVIGSIIIFYGIFGIVTVASKQRSLGTIYIIIVILAIFGTIYAIYWTQRQLLFISADVSNFWNGLTPLSRSYFQGLGSCCGFRNSSDRASLPCPYFNAGGCFPLGRSSPLIEWVRGAMLVSLTCVFAIGFVLCILNIFILFVHEPRKESKGI